MVGVVIDNNFNFCMYLISLAKSPIDECPFGEFGVGVA